MINRINRFFDTYSKYSNSILRIGIGFVFIWFGYSGITNPEMWLRLVPTWMQAYATSHTLVLAHGIVEIVFGLLLMVGIWTRLSAFILFISILHTLFLVSGATLVRDIGVAVGVLALVFQKK